MHTNSNPASQKEAFDKKVERIVNKAESLLAANTAIDLYRAIADAMNELKEVEGRIFYAAVQKIFKNRSKDSVQKPVVLNA